MKDGLESMVDEARQMSMLLERIDDTLSKGIDRLDRTLCAGFITVASEIARVMTGLEQSHITLNEISATLRQPYETQVQGLLREGDRWLKQGELCNGREQTDNRRDALRLFEEVTANKIGATSACLKTRGELRIGLEGA